MFRACDAPIVAHRILSCFNSPTSFEVDIRLNNSGYPEETYHFGKLVIEIFCNDFDHADLTLLTTTQTRNLDVVLDVTASAAFGLWAAGDHTDLRSQLDCSNSSLALADDTLIVNENRNDGAVFLTCDIESLKVVHDLEVVPLAEHFDDGYEYIFAISTQASLAQVSHTSHTRLTHVSHTSHTRLTHDPFVPCGTLSVLAIDHAPL